MRLRTIIILALLIAFAIVIAQNTQEINVRILGWGFVVPLIILLVLTVILGIIVGFLLGRPWRRRPREYATVDRGKGKE